MARQDARKQFVQARLKALGGDATPEQKAKLRQRFNKLSETKEGRTRIAQVVLPSGTAEQRKALKQSIRPVKSTGTSTSTTGGGTTGGGTTGGGSKVDLTGVRDARPYRPTVISDSTTPKNNSQSSAVIPKQVYGDTFEEKVALKLEQWNIPVFGRVAGIGRAIDEGKTSTAVQKLVAAGLDALVTGATFGTVTGFKKGTTPTPTSGSSNPFLGLKPTQFDPSKMRSALESYKGTPTIPSKITGANKPTSMPVTPNFKKIPEFTAGGIDSYPSFKNAPGTAAPKRGKVTTETPGGKKTPTSTPTATTVPKSTATTVPKSTVTTIPQSTTPTTVVAGKPGSVYDQLGTRISGSYKDPLPGDPMPTKPIQPRGLTKADKELWNQSDAIYDYENALYAWQKFNPKK